MSLTIDFSNFEQQSSSDLTGTQEVTVIDSEIKQAKSGVDHLVLKLSFNNKPAITVNKWLCIEPDKNKVGFQIALETIVKLISWKIKKPLKETQKLMKEKGALQNVDKTLLNIVCKVNSIKKEFYEIDKIYAFDDKIKESTKVEKPEPEDVPF